MKLLGVLSDSIDVDRLNQSVSLLIRNKREKVQHYSFGKLNLEIIHHQNETFILNHFNKSVDLIFPNQINEVHLYGKCLSKEIYSPEEIKELNALIIKFNNEEETLSIFSDYFGIKTLYYSHINGEIVFSSEIKAILMYYGKDLFSVNEQSVIEYILFQFQWGEDTLLNEIKILEPRTSLQFKYRANTLKLDKYTQLPSVRKLENIDKVCTNINDLFEKRMNKCKNSSTNIIWLSGGLDSRIILANLVKSRQDTGRIINFGYEYNSDYKLALPIINHYSLEDNFIHYLITPEIILENTIKHLWITEGYSGHLNSHLRYGLEKATNDEDSNYAIFDGYNGDVILGGSFAKKCMSDLFGSLQFDKKFLLRVLKPDFRKKLLKYNRIHFESVLAYNYTDEENLCRKYEYVLYDTYLRRKIRAGGPKLGEEYGIVHIPFTDREFFDSCLAVPIEKRMNHGIYKLIIKKYYPHLEKYPSTSLDIKSKKKNKIQRAIGKYKLLFLRALERLLKINLLKIDTYVNPNEWLRKNKSYREMIFSVLIDDKTEKRGIIDVNTLKSMCKEHMKRKHNYGYLFAMLFDFEMTMRLFTDKDYEVNR